jgi:hypothetical protein
MGSVLSEPMQQFLGGVTRMARTQVVKAIWAYIKENDLQVCGDAQGRERGREALAGGDGAAWCAHSQLMLHTSCAREWPRR